jgi:hypothetical protein
MDMSRLKTNHCLSDTHAFRWAFILLHTALGHVNRQEITTRYARMTIFTASIDTPNVEAGRFLASAMPFVPVHGPHREGSDRAVGDSRADHGDR